MKECIIRLLVKLGILNLNDLNMRTRKRIFGSKTAIKVHKYRAKKHSGVWVKMANIDGSWIHVTTQEKAAEYITSKSIYDVDRNAVYHGLRHQRNCVKIDGDLVAYVQYDKPENA